jgi:hypothetical protein
MPSSSPGGFCVSSAAAPGAPGSWPRPSTSFRPARCDDERDPGPGPGGPRRRGEPHDDYRIIQYKLPPHIDLAACAAHFRRIAPGFRDVPGLIRKQFIYAEDGWGGGVYLSQTRAAAEAFYAGPWLAGIRERYGMDPQIKLFETAGITDNAIGAVLLPDAAGQPGASQCRLA